MREYLLVLISLSVLGGVLGMLSPEGDLKKYLRLICSLCLLCATVTPLVSAWQDGALSLDGWLGGLEEETVDYDEIYNQSLLNGNRIQTENLIKTSIAQELSVSAEHFDVQVSLALKNDIYELSEVRVLLYPQAILVDPKRLTAFVNESYGCPCTVVYE